MEGKDFDISGIKSASISVNSGSPEPLAIANDGTFNATVNLSNGDNLITIAAIDIVDHTSHAQISVRKLYDQTPPIISEPQVSPSQGEIGVLFTISARITDSWSGVNPASVVAHVQYPDETSVVTVQLYDDGATGGDSVPGDGIFTGRWNSSSAVEATYFVDFSASDNGGNVRELENGLLISVYDLPSISNVSATPANPTDTDKVTVSATIQDFSGIAVATLYYSKGTAWFSTNMSFDPATSKYIGTIPPQSAGLVEYKIETTDVLNHSSTSETFSYNVVRPLNTSPVVSDVSASQRAVGGIVDISYNVSDAEQSTVTASFQYRNGTSWVDCETTTGEGNQSIGMGRTGTWDAKADFIAQYMTDAKIRVIADDGQASNNTGYGESGAFTLDTKNPTGYGCDSPADNATGVSVNPTLTALIASDDSLPVSYKFLLAEDSNFTVGVQESDWQSDDNTWIPSTTLNYNDEYWWKVKVKDAYNNETDYETAFKFTTALKKESVWVSKQNMSTPRDNLAAVAFQGKIYAIGGNNSSGPLSIVEVYDPATDTWSTARPMPTPKGSASAALICGKIYVVGGDNRVYSYNPISDEWNERASMPVSSVGQPAVEVINGKMYVSGSNNWMYCYDPSTDSWSSKTPVPVTRGIESFAAIDGKLYAIGGGEPGHVPSEITRIDVYDPATDSWQIGATTDMPTRRTHLGPTTPVINGKIYVIGGWDGDTALSTVEVYNPSADSWSTEESMPTVRYALAYAVVDNKIYAIGGNHGGAGGNWKTVNEEFTPACAILGDFNGDGRINIVDVQKVASRWRTSCANHDPDNNPDTPNYDPIYDLDEDRDIDVVDIMLVVVHWGESCG